MKRFTVNGFVSVLAIGLLLLATANLDAQDVPLTVSIQLTATVQGPDDSGNPIDHIKTTTVTWTTQSLLKLAATASGTNFPTGARLVVTNDTFLVVDKLGNTVEDLTAAGYFSTDHGNNYVLSGQMNNNTGQASWKAAEIAFISFDDGNGNSFDLVGLRKTTASITATDRNSNQKETLSATITLVGEGQVGGNDAVFSGTATASGKGTLSP